MPNWQGTPLPVKPLVHPEKSDMLERKTPRVYPISKDPILAHRPKRDDYGYVTSFVSCGSDLVPEVICKAFMDSFRCFDDR